MKAIIEKQLVQWKEELAKHIQTKNQAQKVLEKGLPDLTGPSLPVPPTMNKLKI